MNSFLGPLTPVVKNLLIINVLMFLLALFMRGRTGFEDIMVLHYVQSTDFRPHQFVTHMFMHANFWHLFGNVLGLWVFGTMLEAVWGPKRFLIFYFVCGIGAVLCDQAYMYFNLAPEISNLNALHESSANAMESARIEELLDLLKNSYTLRGASGAVFGLIMGAALLFPNREIYLYFAIPLKLKYLAILYGVMQFVAMARNLPGDNVAHLVHLGGMLFGLILVMIWRRDRSSFY